MGRLGRLGDSWIGVLKRSTFLLSDLEVVGKFEKSFGGFSEYFERFVSC